MKWSFFRPGFPSQVFDWYKTKGIRTDGLTSDSGRWLGWRVRSAHQWFAMVREGMLKELGSDPTVAL